MTRRRVVVLAVSVVVVGVAVRRARATTPAPAAPSVLVAPPAVPPVRRTWVPRAAAVAALVAVLVAVSGVASAFWTAGGRGDGAAAARSYTVSSSAVVAGGTPLLPGTTGDVRVSVTNDAPVPVRLVAVVPAPSATPSAACGDPRVSFVVPPALPTSTVAPSASAVFVLSGAASMAVDSPNACQGQTVTLPLQVTVQGG